MRKQQTQQGKHSTAHVQKHLVQYNSAFVKTVRIVISSCLRFYLFLEAHHIHGVAHLAILLVPPAPHIFRTEASVQIPNTYSNWFIFVQIL